MIRHSLHKLVILLAMFFVILLCHPAASHAAVGDFLFKWGSYGTGDGQFSFPSSIAVDAGGNVYVTDYLNRVQVFTSTGTFIRNWGSYGTGDGQFNYPSGIAVGAGGNVYVSDFGNHRIQVFTSDGTFIRKWGSYSSGDGQFFFPSDVAVGADGNVYVVDISLSRVQVFTSDGTFIRKWGCYTCGLFSSPYGIAVDASGNVYVADTFNSRIQVFTSDGTFITKWGSSGAGDGQFRNPRGIAVTAGGKVYVAEWNNRVQVFEGLINTPAGSNVTVQPVDPTTGTTPVTITFTSVTTPGMTSVTTSGAGTAPPAGFRLGTPPEYYSIETTAVYSGPIHICINYSGSGRNLRLFHWSAAAGTWQDVTDSVSPGADGSTIICGWVTSFSLFGVFEPSYSFTGFLPPVENPPVMNTAKAGSTIPVKWQLVDSVGSYISDLSVVTGITFQQVQCSDLSTALTNEVPTTTSGSSGLHYDTTANQFVYNWNTDKSMAGNCYLLNLTLYEFNKYEAYFGLK